MNKAKRLDILVICLAIAMGIVVGIARAVDPWWIIYGWLAIVILLKWEDFEQD